MKKSYCVMCGNHLDPKIHVTKFGKSKEQMVELQLELLRDVIKSVYYKCGKRNFAWGKSMFSQEIMNIQDELDSLAEARKL